jgi:hypothetical protein
MNENDINRILRADDSLREAVRRREQRQPPMPAGLNERLMQRIEKEVPAKPENTRRQVWLWMAAASVAAIMIVLLMPPKENGDEAAPCSGEFAIRQNGVGDLKSPQAEKDHRITNPDTQDSRIAYSSELRTANSSELKAIAKSKTENKHKRKAAPRQELPLIHQAEAKPTVLTECNLPITRPENYRYTPEEIALLKKQANEAYIKWMQLELEISKYNLEQMAQQ